MNLGVDKDSTEELIEMVLEGMANEVLLKLEHAHKAEEHTSKETTGEKKLPL